MAQLFGNRLLIQCDDMKEQVGRIIMPNQHSERSRTAQVIAVGDRVENYMVGDKVLISWHIGTHIHLPGQELFGITVDEDKTRIVRDEEILMKL
jgi:co-chaperonin GroES (HSP10)